MKKWVSLFLITILCLSVASCGENDTKRKKSFKNKYGTSTTECAIPGCDNYIASKGDTDMCSYHAHPCEVCRKYYGYAENYDESTQKK